MGIQVFALKQCITERVTRRTMIFLWIQPVGGTSIVMEFFKHALPRGVCRYPQRILQRGEHVWECKQATLAVHATDQHAGGAWLFSWHTLVARGTSLPHLAIRGGCWGICLG